MQKSYLKKISIPLITLLTWILLGMITFHTLENWTWPQCFYYSVITLTTVGYGDFVPTTDLNRFIAAWYILIGVTIAVGSMGYIGSEYINKKTETAIETLNSLKKDDDK